MATSIVDIMNRETSILPIKERKSPAHSPNKPEACGYFATDDNKSSLPMDAGQEILDDASTVISNEAYTSSRSQRPVPNSQARTRPSTTYVEHGIEHQKYHLLVSQDMQSTAQMVDIWLDEDSRKAPFGQKAMRDHTKRATFGGDVLETWAMDPNLAEIWNVGGEIGTCSLLEASIARDAHILDAERTCSEEKREQRFETSFMGGWDTEMHTLLARQIVYDDTLDLTESEVPSGARL